MSMPSAPGVVVWAGPFNCARQYDHDQSRLGGVICLYAPIGGSGKGWRSCRSRAIDRQSRGDGLRVTAPHLHFEVLVGDVQVDPMDWLSQIYP